MYTRTSNIRGELTSWGEPGQAGRYEPRAESIYNPCRVDLRFKTTEPVNASYNIIVCVELEPARNEPISDE